MHSTAENLDGSSHLSLRILSLIIFKFKIKFFVDKKQLEFQEFRVETPKERSYSRFLKIEICLKIPRQGTESGSGQISK